MSVIKKVIINTQRTVTSPVTEVRKVVPHIKGRTQSHRVWEQGTDVNI